MYGRSHIHSLAKDSKQGSGSSAEAGCDGVNMVSRVGRVVPYVLGAAITVAAAPVLAQSNLDAGKSPAQIFSDTCGACHRSPRELKPTSAGFLREHYSTGGREAAAMAAYLASIGSDPRAVQQRRPPTLGAGQAAAPTEAATRAAHANPAGEAGKPDAAKPAAPKPRRPSDSVETGKLPVAALPGGQEGSPAQTAAVPPAAPHPVEEFEE
jgi:hypothetical protein